MPINPMIFGHGKKKAVDDISYLNNDFILILFMEKKST
jgi:hypothetical protein